jgi:hypothetical protein
MVNFALKWANSASLRPSTQFALTQSMSGERRFMPTLMFYCLLFLSQVCAAHIVQLFQGWKDPSAMRAAKGGDDVRMGWLARPIERRGGK